MVYLLISNVVTIIAVIVAYNLGLRNRQALENKENIKVIPNPIDAYKKQKKEDEIKGEIDKLNTIMSNIDAYDGTNKGQVEVHK